jgi:hypothetical protein
LMATPMHCTVLTLFPGEGFGWYMFFLSISYLIGPVLAGKHTMSYFVFSNRNLLIPLAKRPPQNISIYIGRYINSISSCHHRLFVNITVAFVYRSNS